MSKAKKRRKRRSVAGATARRRETAESGFSDMFALPKGMGMFALQSTGTKRIDVIPYTVGEGNPNAEPDAFYWERTFFIHRNVGVNNEMVICPARTVKKRCPICEYRAKLSQDPDAEEKTVKALAPSKRMLMNVVDMKKDPKREKVKVWHISHWYFGKAMDIALAAAYEDHEDNMDNFCDPEDGHYLKCVAEQGYEQRGYEVVRVDFVPRKHDLADETLEAVACLDDILVIKSHEELKEMFFATTDEDEDDEDETPKKKKSKKKKRRESEEDEDEGDEGEEGDEDEGEGEEEEPEPEEEDWDEEEEEKPKKKKSKKKKKRKEPKEEEEEDWEDEGEEGDENGDEDESNKDEEDWEDEDEKPKKKKKRRR